MKREAVQSLRKFLLAAVLFGLVPAAYGATLYAASNGADGAGCGPPASPCRTITRAIANAMPGDTIQVRPGLYGDLDSDGNLGETGEEVPQPGCNCLLSINKPVILISTDGAAATVINAAAVDARTNVLIIASDVEFGRPGHGFFVTNANATNAGGIVIDGTNVKVRGNQVLRTSGDTQGYGIEAVNNASEIVLIEGNQSVGWSAGIVVQDSGKKVSQNQVSFNGAGIAAYGGSVVGNVAINNTEGFLLSGSATVLGNAAHGNRDGFVAVVQDGVIQKNNMFGNRRCGLMNTGTPGLVATHNYWGAVTGPGGDPADYVCNLNNGTTTAIPFATARFGINPSFEP